MKKIKIEESNLKSPKGDLGDLKQQLTDELTQNILHFWQTKMKDKNGGFFGQMTGQNELQKSAARGGILNARILWTFSSAARIFGNDAYKAIAEHARNYIFEHFFDAEFGGTYWMLNADGSVADAKKQIYSQAFFIYALVEYYRLTNDEECLERAKELFYLIEKNSFDKQKNGYFEAYSRDWQLLDDLRLSEKDANEKKTMNTHLHILEAYSNLYRVWKDPVLEQQLQNLILLFTDKIINQETFHLNLFFDEDWNSRSSLVSYGHDIEASWLIDEAAQVLNKADILRKVRSVVLKIADAAAEGLRDNGSIVNEKNTANGHVDTNCDWWPQAEAMVGYYNAYQISGNSAYLNNVLKNWTFINENIIDRENGEWVWAVNENGIKDLKNDKAGFWKCPYHNSRMCLELIERIAPYEDSIEK